MSSITDELAFIDAPVSDEDLILKILTGLSLNFNSFVVATNTRSEPHTLLELQAMPLTHIFSTLIRISIKFLTGHVLLILDLSPLRISLVVTHPEALFSLHHLLLSLGLPFLTPLFLNLALLFAKYTSKKVILFESVTRDVMHVTLILLSGLSLRILWLSLSSPLPAPTPPLTTEWLLDSGASHHVTNDLNALFSFNSYEGFNTLHIGNGQGMPINHIGSFSITIFNFTLHFTDVLHVPTFTKNLLRLSRSLSNNSLLIEFSYFSCFYQGSSNHDTSSSSKDN
jgi:hypothetical protein